jgi:ubiquinone/menaquinone biosynthesis C-methylase UbiE
MNTQRQTMSEYYARHAWLYDATRWAFLLNRDIILTDLRLCPGEKVIEIGCGTGRNFSGILRQIGSEGELIAVDCSPPMLIRCRRRIRREGWPNVHLVDKEYGSRPVSEGQADAVLMSYSLSMIPFWREVVECVRRELKPGGRLGVVDFCLARRSAATLGFSRWMAFNHVTLDNPYREHLSAVFNPVQCVTQNVLGGLWAFYRFVGRRGEREIRGQTSPGAEAGDG